MIDINSLEFRALKCLCDLCVGLDAGYSIQAMAEELDISEKQSTHVFGVLAGHGLVHRSSGPGGYSVFPTESGYEFVRDAMRD